MHGYADPSWTWDLGPWTWDLGPGTLDLFPGPWDLGYVPNYLVEMVEASHTTDILFFQRGP